MIEQRKLNNLGISASLLGYGAMRFPINGDDHANIDMEKTQKLIDVAIENGVNYFDTARFYHNGKSEEAIGELLKKYPREDLFYATKLPIGDVKQDSDVFDIVEEQLSKLQTDYIDFYLLHGVGRGCLAGIEKFKILEKMEQLKASGKIRYIGFSFHDNLETFKIYADMYDWDFCMIQLNYVDVDSQQGIEGYNILTQKGIPVMIMEPLKGGTLTSFNPEISKLFNDIDSNATVASFAMRWAASLPNVKVIMSGMTEMEHLMDNIKTLTDFKPLSDAEIEACKQVKKMIEGTSAVPCTFCKYCMPCPLGVDIAGAFSAHNQYVVYNNVDRFNDFMRYSRSSNQNPEKCTGCGVCLEKCPQKIDIPTKLQDVLELEKQLNN